MIKFNFTFDKDKEIEWLNQMAAEGWGMTGFAAGFYNFEKCDKGKWNYQIDFGDKLFAVSDEYREFMEDTGAEIVQTWAYWVFLRKPASEGKFELYTDVDSSLEHYMKIRKFFKIVTIIEIICFFTEILAAINGFHVGYVFAFLFAVILASFSNALIRINNIIGDLNERKTGIASRRRKMTVLIPMGMLALSVSLLTKDYVPHGVTLILQITSIVLELLGMLQCINSR